MLSMRERTDVKTMFDHAFTNCGATGATLQIKLFYLVINKGVGPTKL